VTSRSSSDDDEDLALYLEVSTAGNGEV
jgi:hypothetical protein